MTTEEIAKAAYEAMRAFNVAIGGYDTGRWEDFNEEAERSAITRVQGLLFVAVADLGAGEEKLTEIVTTSRRGRRAARVFVAAVLSLKDEWDRK